MRREQASLGRSVGRGSGARARGPELELSDVRSGVDRRALLLGLIVVASVAGILLAEPIAQDPAYHRFADTRAWLGIPNFANVVSNLPFLVAGLVGAMRLVSGRPSGALARLRPTYLVFFVGSALVAIGSSYYHWAPSSATLAWDRATMTVAFMAFCSMVVGEQLGAELGRRLLVPLLAVGLLSVVWWRLGDGAGEGDLRLYILVQFLPLLVLPFLLALYPPSLAPTSWIWGVFACYALAKLFEMWDAPLLRWTGVGGHAWKHVAAAGGVVLVVLALERRQPSAAGASKALQ